MISSDHLHYSGHEHPHDTNLVLNWDSWEGEAAIPLLGWFLPLIILDIICVLRIDLSLPSCHFQPVRTHCCCLKGADYPH